MRNDPWCSAPAKTSERTICASSRVATYSLDFTDFSRRPRHSGKADAGRSAVRKEFEKRRLPMHRHLAPGMVALALLATHASTQVLIQPPIPAPPQPILGPWVAESVYRDTLFLTPNGDPVSTGPMLHKMLGAGDPQYMHPTDPDLMGGGRYTKVGIVTDIYYTSQTEGPNPDPALHMRYYVNRGPAWLSLPLPPDVTSLQQLPALVRLGYDLTAGTPDDLPAWATLAQCPRVIAALEWSRYLNLPISFQLHCTISHGGQQNSLEDLDWYTESSGKDQCQWDAADICDPNDDNPATFESSGATWGTFSYATPTLADPALAQNMGYNLPYRALVMRNMHDAVTQLLALGQLQRYKGRFVAMALDPEIHMPAHLNPAFPLPKLGGGTEVRGFFEDYHPVMVRQFGEYMAARYGDTAPNVDSNGDGATFWADFSADYLASGGFGHSHAAVPTSWAAVDPPRNYPATKSSPRAPYWQEWCNFLTDVVEGYLEELVQTAVDAGVPPTRIYTHQTMANGSYEDDRAQWENLQWLDDWKHLETSYGYMGISQYQPYGVEGVIGGFNQNYAYYRNLSRRDESWGAPEYNPWVINPVPYQSTHATLPQMNTIMNKAWDTGAHVLWMHYWGAPDYCVIDVQSKYWVLDPYPGTVGLIDPVTSTPWTVVGMVPIGNPPTSLKATTANDSYLESPPLSYQAATYPCLKVDTIAFSGASGQSTGSHFDMRVQFQRAGVWHMVTETNWMAYDTSARQTFAIDLSKDPNYTGTITGLRYHIVGHPNAWGNVAELNLCAQNEFTIAAQALMVAKKDTRRPAMATPIAIPPVLRLNNVIPAWHASGQLVVYGNDPIDPQNTNFTDFGYQGNFYPATVSARQVARPSIVAPASRLIGQVKTGKYRKLTLPNTNSVTLSFGIGIVDGFTSTDGVHFRVVLRDHETRAQVELFSRERRKNAWADYVIDLSAWRGKTIDLLFETHAISVDTGDRAAWSNPTIVSS
jgi:hypothetical protein